LRFTARTKSNLQRQRKLHADQREKALGNDTDRRAHCERSRQEPQSETRRGRNGTRPRPDADTDRHHHAHPH
jgi:hypothetical protein